MNSAYDNNNTYYENSINSSDIPTIFIHGVGLNVSMWKPQKIYFQKKNVIFYDLLNHGKSRKNYENLKFEDFNNQLIKLVNFLKIKKFNLIGFSIGALIAQHFTSKYYNKINKLIIIASIYKRSEEQKEKVRNRYEKCIKGQSITNDSINRWFNSEYLKKNPKVYKYFYNILEDKNNKDFLPAYKLFVESDKYELNFKNLNMPTLIMTGEYEIGSTPKMSIMLNKKISGSDFYIIPKAKHMASYEKSNLVNKKISNFLY